MKPKEIEKKLMALRKQGATPEEMREFLLSLSEKERKIYRKWVKPKGW